MKMLIFAGGAGTRLWPLSRKELPKQFKKIFDGKSTIQLAVERIEKTFGTNNIYISTNENYVSIVKAQVPQINASNIIGEPCKRDLAAAIGYNFIRLRKKGYSGPVSILWADHLMENVQNFIEVLRKGELLVNEDPNRLVFVGETARYAENNLGWIHLGRKIKENAYEYKGWVYKPSVKECQKMFNSKEWVWNPGYFVVDLNFVLNLYQKFLPIMYSQLLEIEKALGTVDENRVLEKIYPTLEEESFDKAIIEKIELNQAIVLKTQMGWADPGTLYALKEAIVGNDGENYEKGLTYNVETKDSVVINEEKEKLLATIGLNNMVIVNTEDVLLVVHKDNVVKISDLVKQLEKDKKLKGFI